MPVTPTSKIFWICWIKSLLAWFEVFHIMLHRIKKGSVSFLGFAVIISATSDRPIFGIFWNVRDLSSCYISNKHPQARSLFDLLSYDVHHRVVTFDWLLRVEGGHKQNYMCSECELQNVVAKTFTFWVLVVTTVSSWH